MAAGTCFAPKEEQLYMLELLVDRLNLSPEKVQEVRTTPLCVRLNFIDFPTFEISQEEFSSFKRRKKKELAASPDHKSKDGFVDFSAGKSCLFPKQPRDLVQAMQLQPLKVGVYERSDKPVCDTLNENSPICETQVPLSGCLCDQVAMAMNDADHLPKPYTLKNIYNLIDLQGRPSGTIAIFLRLSCFGKSIVTHFSLQETSFLFKSSSSANEFQCTRVPPDEEELAKRAKEVKDKICLPEGYEVPNLDPLPKPQDVIGLASICQELAMRDGGPAEVIPSAEQMPLSCHVGIAETASEELTSVPKPNDRDCGGLVYREYPNDPTSACSQSDNYPKALAGDFPCSGADCGGGLCVGTKRIEPSPRNHFEGSDGMPCCTGNCCAESPRNDIMRTSEGCCGRPRMRGGGCCDGGWLKTGNIGSLSEEGHNAFKTVNENNFSNHGDRPGGAATQSIDTLISGACKSPLGGGGSNSKPGCYCFGMTGGGEMAVKSATGTKGGVACTKEPCSGIDCLIRAFKETQDFVDSIGKVSGLAGLGLMDPSESPYFGREGDFPKTSCGMRKTAQLPSSQLPNALTQQCPGPCNTQDPKKVFVAGSSVGSIQAASTSPVASSAIGRSGALVRDALASQPKVVSTSSFRVKKNQEKTDTQKDQETTLPPSTKIETGPCGEPKCKSRRKRAQEEPIVDNQSMLSLAKKTTPISRLMSVSSKAYSRGKSGDKGKQQGRVKSNGLDPAGDRNNAAHPYIKVSKRIMKFVYSSGTRSPGFNYGHKNCIETRMRVPANMGWLWNTNKVVGKFKPRFGWKPGAISKYLYDLLEEAKACSGSVESRPVSTPTKGRKGKVTKTRSFQSIGRGSRVKKKEGGTEKIELPPTLHIHRKDGTYYVTMYPVNQESTDMPQLEEPLKPLQFKITKNKDDDSICSSSTASDMELEFSPPAALNRYHKKPDVIHVDTQVKQQEILDALKPPGSKQGNGKKGKKEKTKRK